MNSKNVDFFGFKNGLLFFYKKRNEYKHFYFFFFFLDGFIAALCKTKCWA